MKASIIVSIIISAFFFQSCRSTKKITTAIAKKDTAATIVINPALPKVDSVDFAANIFQKVTANKINCEWFFAKLKVDYDDNSGQNNDINAQIKIRKDSVIWISISKKIVGITAEGIRVLITKDSIKVMDKIHNEITCRSISYLQDLTQLPFDFATMQDFILGNPVFFSNHIVYYKQSGNQTQALSTGAVFKHLITIDTASNQILHSKLDDADLQKNRTCDITFNNYENNNGRVFATERDIVITEKSKLAIHLRYKQYSFDQPQNFPFTVPKSYKLIQKN